MWKKIDSVIYYSVIPFRKSVNFIPSFSKTRFPDSLGSLNLDIKNLIMMYKYFISDSNKPITKKWLKKSIY